MSARGFKSVGWVAAVGGAALSCYMLSLRVATERNELARVERQIIAAKQEIRSLQTELGTRGRLSQLENWNADVLALAAPVSGQFLEDEFTLARFDQREPDFAERSAVRLASGDTNGPAAAVKPVPAARAAPAAEAPEDAAPETVAPPVRMASAPVPALTASAQTAQAQAVSATSLRRASFAPADKPRLEPRKSLLADAKLSAEIGAAAKAEKNALDKPAKAKKAIKPATGAKPTELATATKPSRAGAAE